MGETLYRCDLDDRMHTRKPTCVNPEVAGVMSGARVPVTHELVAEWLDPGSGHDPTATFETCPKCIADARPSHP